MQSRLRSYARQAASKLRAARVILGSYAHQQYTFDKTNRADWRLMNFCLFFPLVQSCAIFTTCGRQRIQVCWK